MGGEWRVGESLSPATRNPETVVNQLANWAAVAMSHDVEVEVQRYARFGGGRHRGRIVRREIDWGIYTPRERGQAFNGSSPIVLHFDDGATVPIQEIVDMRRV